MDPATRPWFDMSLYQKQLLSFTAFVTAVGLIGGGLYAAYWDSKFKTLSKRAFSTEEISKAKKLGRKLRRAEAKNTDLESEIAVLNHQINVLMEVNRPEVSSGNAKQSSLSTLLGDEAINAVGIKITLQDAEAAVQLGENPNLGIVHNVDLLQLVNQLWSAGATAIAINQQRIVADSDITCAGPIITINKTRITSPFVIEASGPTNKLLSVLNSKQSYLKYLNSYGIATHIELEAVNIPAYTLEIANSDAGR